MRSFYIVVLFCLVGWSEAQKCPAKYRRFSKQHTFCLNPNPSCEVRSTGVSQQDKELILRLHNQYRSKVAMGKERGTLGGDVLPQAANMMQMEWDDELAAVAQKWTENCRWGHDCNNCRAVEKFGVGQNLAIKNHNACYGSNCLEPDDKPNWKESIDVLYSEVKDFHKNWLANFQKHDDPKTGHFTQVIWAKSWRIGCGYAFYKKNGRFHKYYACNYGPAGNFLTQPVYEEGRPCSGCPINTQCSSSGRIPNGFPGLCKMKNPNTAPEYPENPKGLLFLCGADKLRSHCQADVSGDRKWKTVRSVGGNYHSIELKGGESTTLSFHYPITPHGNGFCLLPTFRKGPLDASKRDQSILKLNFKMGRMFANPMNLDTGEPNFVDYGINLGWGAKTLISFTFSVPNGARRHVLDIRKIMAFDGNCNSRKV